MTIHLILVLCLIAQTICLAFILYCHFKIGKTLKEIERYRSSINDYYS